MAEHSSDALGPAATLGDALAAWRADRASVVRANAVDAIAVPMLAPPAKVHGWWMELAKDYDPVLATTLLATLDLQARGGGARHLVQRIDRMLAWPSDDPRVALALARRAREAPFTRRRMTLRTDRSMVPMIEAIARWIIACGDLRALGEIGNLRPVFGDDVREAVATALEHAPSPRVREVPVGAAWHAVLAEPFALAPRLVLADAYLERGDPRGELIALQCAPFVAIEQAAGQPIDAHGLFGRGRSRIDALLHAHWYRWFGELSPVLAERSEMKAGLFARVALGRDRTPAWAWPFAAQHHELCALEEVTAMHRVDPGGYATFVRALRRMPRWVYLNDELLGALGRAPLPLVGVRYYVGRRSPIEVAHELVAIAPGLARLKIQYGYPQHMDTLHDVMNAFPQLRVELVT